jgi:hypothetical protein
MLAVFATSIRHTTHISCPVPTHLPRNVKERAEKFAFSVLRCATVDESDSERLPMLLWTAYTSTTRHLNGRTRSREQPVIPDRVQVVEHQRMSAFKSARHKNEAEPLRQPLAPTREVVRDLCPPSGRLNYIEQRGHLRLQFSAVRHTHFNQRGEGLNRTCAGRLAISIG